MAGKGGTALRSLVSAVLALGLRAEIPRFFYVAKISAAKMLLFFRKPGTMDILTKRGFGRTSVAGKHERV